MELAERSAWSSYWKTNVQRWPVASRSWEKPQFFLLAHRYDLDRQLAGGQGWRPEQLLQSLPAHWAQFPLCGRIATHKIMPVIIKYKIDRTPASIFSFFDNQLQHGRHISISIFTTTGIITIDRQSTLCTPNHPCLMWHFNFTWSLFPS